MYKEMCIRDRYNIYNYLTALLLVNKLGFKIEDILLLNEKLKAPAGRMELIKYNTNSIFVDYAHTPCLLYTSLLVILV